MDLAHEPPNGDVPRQRCVNQFIQIWRNERLAPELLPFQPDLYQELDRAAEQMLAIESSKDLRNAFRRREGERVRYLLNSYMRSRLVKIERMAFDYQSDPKYLDRMTPNEVEFCREFAKSVQAHLRESVLCHLPLEQRALDEGMFQSSNPTDPEGQDSILEQAVLARSTKDAGDIEVAGVPASMEKDAIVMVPYNIIKYRLEKGDVELV